MNKTIILLTLLALALPLAALAQKPATITKSHIEMPLINHNLYIIPPEPSFALDTMRQFFGLSSPKFPGVILRFIYSAKDYHDNDSLVNKNYKLLKKIKLQNKLSPKTSSNYDWQYRVWAYKVASKNSDSLVTWLIYINDDISYAQGMFSYPKELEPILGKYMERSIASIVLVPNAKLIPENSINATADWKLLPPGLTFVRQLRTPAAYFTEDGKPANTSKGQRWLAVCAPPDYIRTEDVKVDIAIDCAQRVMEHGRLPDSVIIETLAEQTYPNANGYWLKGSLKADTAKRIDIYYIDDLMGTYMLVVAVANRNDTAFFEAVPPLVNTIRRPLKGERGE